jgi:hypothetical protein
MSMIVPNNGTKKRMTKHCEKNQLGAPGTIANRKVD